MKILLGVQAPSLPLQVQKPGLHVLYHQMQLVSDLPVQELLASLTVASVPGLYHLYSNYKDHCDG